MDSRVAEIRKVIAEYPRIVFLGGAGVSTASGIPDFRSPQGLYNVQNKYGVSYETMLSRSYFESHTKEFYEFYFGTMVNEKAKPNAAHLALAAYEKRTNKIAILTQNIDGLHQKAGSRKVYELHGSTLRYRCLECGHEYSLDEIPHVGIPHCPKCGGLIKPDVVLYEESLDEMVLRGAVDELSFSDVLIVGGTSLNVYPAAGLIDYFGGRLKILINKEATPRDKEFDYVFHEDIGTTLTEILS